MHLEETEAWNDCAAEAQQQSNRPADCSQWLAVEIVS
jgi:hypothetical protein